MQPAGLCLHPGPRSPARRGHDHIWEAISVPIGGGQEDASRPSKNLLGLRKLPIQVVTHIFKVENLADRISHRSMADSIAYLRSLE